LNNRNSHTPRSLKVGILMGGPGGLGPPGGGVAGARQAAFAAIRNPLRGVA
jgi:hypothetical protein